MASTHKKTKFVGQQTFLNQATGELIDCNVVQLEERDHNFHKIWLAHILSALSEIGGAKIKVLCYLLDSKDYSNNITQTVREIAEKTGCSPNTVTATLIALKDADVITRKTGVIKLNPNVIFKGSYGGRMNILLEYNALKQPSNVTPIKQKALQAEAPKGS